CRLAIQVSAVTAHLIASSSPPLGLFPSPPGGRFVVVPVPLVPVPETFQEVAIHTAAEDVDAPDAVVGPGHRRRLGSGLGTGRQTPVIPLPVVAIPPPLARRSEIANCWVKPDKS